MHLKAGWKTVKILISWPLRGQLIWLFNALKTVYIQA